jgi:exopolysaccharide production protein ExoZ
MLNRIKRIVPLYWLATLAMVACAIAAPALFKTLRWDGEALVKSLLFVPYYSLSFPDKVEPLLVPGWSLNYEMFFYVMFAAVLLVGRNWRVPLMVGVMAGLVTIGLVWHPKAAALATYTSPRLLEFGAGMILGRLWVMRKHPRQDGGQPVLMALGDASYSIYLTHVFTLGALRVLWSHFIHNATLGLSIAWVALSLVGCAMVGWLCYLLVEQPITRGLKRWRSFGSKQREVRA